MSKRRKKPMKNDREPARCARCWRRQRTWELFYNVHPSWPSYCWDCMFGQYMSRDPFEDAMGEHGSLRR